MRGKAGRVGEREERQEDGGLPVDQIDARIISSESKYGIATLFNHDSISAHWFCGKSAGDTVEGPYAGFGSCNNLEGVPMHVPGVTAVVVVIDYHFNT